MAGPRFFGFVIGGSLPAALAANWLAGAWDQNTGLYNVTPGDGGARAGRARVDARRARSSAAAARGAFVTGTTVAHITALAAARHAVLARAGWNVEADGLFGAPPITVDRRRRSAPDAVQGARRARPRTQARGARAGRRPRPHARRRRCRELYGPDDRLRAGRQREHRRVRPAARDLRARARRRARGSTSTARSGCGRASRRRARYLADGIELADSWATDAHKWLNVPYDCGLAFVRDGDALRRAMAISAEYLPTASEHRNPSDFTPELSRRARGVDVWAALRALGRSGVDRADRAQLPPGAPLRRSAERRRDMRS